jgi:hypothetical protein
MWFSHWLRRMRQRLHLASRPGKPPARSRRARPQPEYLEERLTPATFTVLNTNNDGAGSLRQAILAANAAPNIDGPDRIEFNIPADAAGHVYYRDDGVTGHVSLANVTATTAADDFAIADIDPDWRHSWWSIQPKSALPAIRGPVVIDGYTREFQEVASSTTVRAVIAYQRTTPVATRLPGHGFRTTKVGSTRATCPTR